MTKASENHYKESVRTSQQGALFEIWLSYLANYIPVGHDMYTQLTRPFPLLRKYVWLGRLVSKRKK